MSLAALALAALLLAAAAGAAAAAKEREPVKVTPKDALYPVAGRLPRRHRRTGATIAGCLIVPLTACPGAGLDGRS